MRLDERWLVHISSAAAIIAYKATGRRQADEAPYLTFASSTYVRAGGDWKLAFHQQTPTA